MAGFVTWLRRQDDRDDSVGALSRELIREDPLRDVWLYEDYCERLAARGDSGWRSDALAGATEEWGVTAGIPVCRPADTRDRPPAPRQGINVPGPHATPGSVGPSRSKVHSGSTVGHEYRRAGSGPSTPLPGLPR